MKIAIYTDVTRETLNDVKYVSLLLRHNLVAAKKRYLKQSLRLLYPVVEFFDQHGDNFIKNVITCRTEFVGYKVPRIIKNLISKNIKRYEQAKAISEA